MTPEQNRLRARLAAHAKNHPNDTATITELRRDLKADRLAHHVARVVDDWPPLTSSQREKIAVLLRGGAS